MEYIKDFIRGFKGIIMATLFIIQFLMTPLSGIFKMIQLFLVYLLIKVAFI